METEIISQGQQGLFKGAIGLLNRLESVVIAVIVLILVTPSTVFSVRQFIEAQAKLEDEAAFLTRFVSQRPELVVDESGTLHAPDPIMISAMRALVGEGTLLTLSDGSGDVIYRYGATQDKPAVSVVQELALAELPKLYIALSHSLRARLPLLFFVIGVSLFSALLAGIGLHEFVFKGWRRAERERAVASARLADIADVAKHWFWETDSDYRIVVYTLRHARFNDLVPKGFRLWDVDALEPMDSWEALQSRLLARENVEFRYTFKSGGAVRYHELVGKPFFDLAGSFAGYRGAGYDVTEGVERETELISHRDRLDDRVLEKTQELASARDKAEQANMAKSSFIANISHEIRTPMNVILGTAQLLEGSELSERQKRWLSNLRRAGDHLLSLINDVLDFSKIEAAKLQIEERRVDLDAMISKAVVLFSDRAQAKGIELLVDERWPVGVVPCGDEQRIGQIVINFLSNAIKFTESGFVCLRVDGELRGDEEVWLQFVVSDSGIGIDYALVKHIFGAFQQAESLTTRTYGGTGLGLSISAGLAALMGGNVGVESELGEGSSFWFECVLPLETSGADAPTLDLQQRAVILGFDSKMVGILQYQLEAVGFAVAFADPDEWVPALLVAESRPDAVFIDDRLLAARTDYDQFLMSALPDSRFYCLSDTDDPTHVNRDLPCARRLAKPLRRSSLREAVIASAPEAEPQLEAQASDMTGIQVLVVDDDIFSRELLGELLGSRGITVSAADGGQSALDLLNGGVVPDLILMDMQMPDMDGLAASRAIRAALGDEAPPVIAFTANVTPEHRLSALDAGMVAFAIKPVDLDALLALMGAVLSSAEELRASGSQLSSAEVQHACELLDAGDPAVNRWLAQHLVRLRLAVPDHFCDIQRAIRRFDFSEAAKMLRSAFSVTHST